MASAGSTTYKPSIQIQIQPKQHPTETMLAATWQGSKDIQLRRVPKPMITDEKDVIIKVTSSSICGSDLHLFHNEVAEMERGDILGHEFMGIVEDIGPQVTKIQKGQRVVCSFNISCGECSYCRKRQFTACDTTNPSKTMERMYGHRCVGMFGYSHLTGGYPGGQAEYVRVPLADFNCLVIKDDTLTDEQVLFLSDAAITGYHANILGEVSQGQTVVIWGAGPVGLFAAKWALDLFKVSRCLIIDSVPARLQFAVDKIGKGILTLNYHEHDVMASVQQIFPGGPDVVIDAAGFRYAKTTLQKIERALHLETDACDVLTEAITLVKKYGHVSIIADYVGLVNQFPIGAVMEKGLTLRGSQAPVQKYWKDMLNKIQQREIDVSFMVTDRFHLTQISEAYQLFDQKERGVIKVILKTDAGLEREKALTSKQSSTASTEKSFSSVETGVGKSQLHEQTPKTQASVEEQLCKFKLEE